MAKVNSIGNATSELNVNEAYSLPTVDGSSGNVLTTDGSGNVSWLAQASGGLTYEEITEATKAMQVNYCYYANRSLGIEFTLPVSSANGDIIKIVGISGIWKVGQNDSQSIYFGTDNTIVGITGKLVADNVGDCVTLCCIEANISWRAVSYWGTFHKEG